MAMDLDTGAPIATVLTQAAQFTNVAPLATTTSSHDRPASARDHHPPPAPASDSGSSSTENTPVVGVVANGRFPAPAASGEPLSRKAYQDALWKHTQAQWQGVRLEIENRSRRGSL